MQHAATPPLRAAAAGLVGMGAAMGIGRFIYTPILPGMMEELGLSASDAGLIASANYLGYLLGAVLAAGAWAAGVETAILVTALSANALLLAAMGLTSSIGAFIALRLCGGLASAFIMIFLSTRVLGRLVASGRSELQAMHFSGVGVGIAAASVIILVLAIQGAGWQAGWFWGAGLAAFAAILVPAMLRSSNGAATRAASVEPPLPADRALRAVIFAYGLFGFGYIVTATFLIAIVRANGSGPLFEPVVWLVTGLASAPSTWLWQRIGMRTGLAPAFVGCCVVEAVGVVASVSIGGHAGPLIAGALLGGTFVAATALGLQIGRTLAPMAPRRALALMTAAFGVGQISGPVVTGYLADLAGYTLPSVLAALALLIAALVVLRTPLPNSP
jgi:predicted MFS family arabinose efflux permease